METAAYLWQVAVRVKIHKSYHKCKLGLMDTQKAYKKSVSIYVPNYEKQVLAAHRLNNFTLFWQFKAFFPPNIQFSTYYKNW